MSDIHSLDVLLRILVGLLLIARFAYWRITEQRSDSHKAKTQQASTRARLERLLLSVMGVVMLLQLAGFDLLVFPRNVIFQVVGAVLTLVGFVVCISARRTLGNNWAHAAEYQIKENHELVTSGVYKYLRNPIYTGIFLTIIGAELVACSYVAVILAVVLVPLAYRQAIREEQILRQTFGKTYTAYAHKTKQFIPFIW